MCGLRLRLIVEVTDASDAGNAKKKKKGWKCIGSGRKQLELHIACDNCI
jgi:hypothetical protein